MSVVAIRHKTLYGLGQFAWASKDVAFHYFLFFFYSQYLGLSASLAGLAALLALVADAVSDPIIGQISDNFHQGKWGRRHPFMIGAIIPYALALIALFNPPDGLSEAALFGWFLGFAILVRTLLTFFTVPHMALGAELSTGYEERTTIATYRNFIGYVGGLLIQVAAWFLIIPVATAAGDAAAGYANVGYFAAAIAVVGMTAAILGTRSRIPHLEKTSTEQQARPGYYAFTDILSILRLHSGRILFFGTLLMVARAGIANTMLIHINKLHYGFSDLQIGIFMLAVFLALVPSAWLAGHVTRKREKRDAAVLFILLEAIVGPIPVLAHLYGLLPSAGSMTLLLIVCGFVAIQQSFHIAFLHVGAGMLPDIVDEGETKTGMRQEGIYNSAMMFTQKVTFGVGAFVAGLAVDFAGVEGITDKADVTFEMASRLAWVYGAGAALLTLAAAFIFTRYRLDRKRHAEIRLELEGEHGQA